MGRSLRKLSIGQPSPRTKEPLAWVSPCVRFSVPRPNRHRSIARGGGGGGSTDRQTARALSCFNITGHSRPSPSLLLPDLCATNEQSVTKDSFSNYSLSLQQHFSLHTFVIAVQPVQWARAPFSLPIVASWPTFDFLPSLPFPPRFQTHSVKKNPFPRDASAQTDDRPHRAASENWERHNRMASHVTPPVSGKVEGCARTVLEARLMNVQWSSEASLAW